MILANIIGARKIRNGFRSAEMVDTAFPVAQRRGRRPRRIVVRELMLSELVERAAGYSTRSA
jgi:hypothetical protein